MSKTIALLGSTGSVGKQSLQVIEHLNYKVAALSAASNIDLLEEQIHRHNPSFVGVLDEAAAEKLRSRLNALPQPPVLFAGKHAAGNVVAECGADLVLNAIVGIAGLESTLTALASDMDIALANKESLVAGGQLVMRELQARGRQLLPVDSEHSAIFQCLQDDASGRALKKIILTASGGPFYGKKVEDLRHVSVAQTLAHPNWNMGKKITVDSATLMNKGLEFIEAMWLFDRAVEDIEIVIQRESIIHSMVEFADSSILAQLSVPDMSLPIQYALTWPERRPSTVASLDFAKISQLTFGMPDRETFQCLDACYLAAQKGGLAPCAANGANEEAVDLFLQGEIGFLDIGRIVKQCVESDSFAGSYSLEDVYDCDRMARRFVHENKKG